MRIVFIRKSDNKEFAFEKTGNGYILNPSTVVIPAPEIESASYNYAGIDGGYAPNASNREMRPLQVRRPRAFDVSGWLLPDIDMSQNVSKMMTEINEFFRVREYYRVVYERCSEIDFYLDNVILTDGPFVSQTAGPAEEIVASVELSFLALDPAQYKAVFDDNGELVPSGSLVVPKTLQTEGGRVWGADGATWQASNGGKKWTLGSQGAVNILVDSSDNIYPVITITGQAINPVITDITTNTSLSFNGTVAEGQKLVLDCANKTAKLGGANVISKISGTWLYLESGINKFEFTAGGTTQDATLEWNDVVG